MYIETMEEVLAGTDKVLIDQTGNGQGVIPYLPLPELQRSTGPARPADGESSLEQPDQPETQPSTGGTQ
jgi:membrane protease subunit HflK